MKEKYDIKCLDTESSFISSFNYSSSDIEFRSLIEKNNIDFPNNKFFNYLISKKKNKKPIQITGIKNFPTYFFISFILIVSILSFKFVPNFVGFADKNNKIEDFVSKRHTLKYFSNYFKEMNFLSKITLLFSQIILLTISLSLNSIFLKQPSIIFNKKLLYYSTNIFSFISTMSLVLLSFYSEITKGFSNKYNLVDDITLLVYINSTFCLSVLLYWQVKEINRDLNQFVNVQDKYSLFKEKKMYFVILMALQAFSYSLSIFLLSFYNPLETYEKFAQFILILCLNINSILFLFTWALFILNLNSDFSDVLISLEFDNANEYYIDLDHDNKNVL